MYKIISHNVRGLNGSRKRRQVFRWLHQQNSDIILLQETYSSPEAIGRWEAEWGGKIISSHGSTHSRGVMILFKPWLDVSFKITTDKYGRYILAEIVIDNTKVVLVNVYAPNDPNQQVVFLRELSNNVLSNYQGHPTDCFGRISVRKTCNRLKFSVREMSSRAFLIKIN